MRIYSFTVKGNSTEKWPMRLDYEQWVENAKSKGFFIQFYTYELDSGDRLHIHGVAHWLGSRPLYKKSLVFQNMHQRIDELPDSANQKRYLDYCYKQFQNEDEQNQMIIGYEFRHSNEYPFRES